jgi:hypothetical protein
MMVATAAEPINVAAPRATPPHLFTNSSADLEFKNDVACSNGLCLRLSLKVARLNHYTHQKLEYTPTSVKLTGISVCKKSSPRRLSDGSPPAESPNFI